MENMVFSKIKSATDIAEVEIHKGGFVWKYVKHEGLFLDKYNFYQLILFLSNKFLGVFTVSVIKHTMVINVY